MPILGLGLGLVLREAGTDWTEVERFTSDRKVWKEKMAERMEHLDRWEIVTERMEHLDRWEKVAERMEHLDRWERQKGHGYRWEQGEGRLARNVERGERELICRYEGCGIM